MKEMLMAWECSQKTRKERDYLDDGGHRSSQRRKLLTWALKEK